MLYLNWLFLLLLSLLLDKGEIFGWGNSEYSQLPKSGVVQVCSPIRLGCFDHVGKIKDIAAGGTTCLALNGELFVLLLV